MNFENKIMNLKDSLPPEPVGMESWILNRIVYPKAFCEDGDKCWCGKCGSHFHTTRATENVFKSVTENPCKFCAAKSCSHSCLTQGEETPRTECSTYKNIREMEVDTKCPVCQSKVKLVLTTKERFFQRVECSALMEHHDIQMLRNFIFDFTFIKGHPMKVEVRNVCNLWISEKGAVRVTRPSGPEGEREKEPLLHLTLSKGTYNYRRHINSIGNKEEKYPLQSLDPEHYMCRTLYPEIQLASYLKKRGLLNLSNNQINGLNTWGSRMLGGTGSLLRFIKCVIRYPFVETLLKRKDFDMLYALFLRDLKLVKKLLPSYYIATRRGYKPSDVNQWIEMVLAYDNAAKDIRNPRYLCCENLSEGVEEARTLWYEKAERERSKRVREFKEGRQRDIFWYLEENPDEAIKCEADQDYFNHLIDTYGGMTSPPGLILRVDWWCNKDGIEYVEVFGFNEKGKGYYEDPVSKAKTDERFKRMKGKFFNMDFGDDEIRIVSLNSIEEYHLEAKSMHNCIEEHCYFLNPDTLVLSARKNGKPIADIEVSLRTYEIIQCLGPCNRETPYQQKIERLILSNLKFIVERNELGLSA